ncbi:MAG: cyclic nucleotide-binding domain-containing protein [Oscillospiraceae bacterium]|nr:cyclic nucleotide-binding domain-containing protein [Oscillospiraceae bacterium]
MEAMLLQGTAAERLLERYPVYKLFSVPVKQRLLVRRVAAGEVIYSSDAPGSSLIFIAEGRAKTCVMHNNGVESLVSILDAGTIMGDMELVGEKSEEYIVKTMHECFTIELPYVRDNDPILADVRFLRILCRILADKLHRNDIRFSALLSYPLKARFAAFVLNTQVHGIFRERLTETAQHLGVSYRQMQRVVASLCRSGALRRQAAGYAVADARQLEKLGGAVVAFTKSEGFLRFL